jgi:hypothetical protein
MSYEKLSRIYGMIAGGTGLLFAAAGLIGGMNVAWAMVVFFVVFLAVFGMLLFFNGVSRDD